MLTDNSCDRFDEIHSSTSVYLFPFVLEYSLIAMGTLTIMYASIGEEADKKDNILRGIQNLFKIRALEKSSERDKLYHDDLGGTLNDSAV
jgi:Otopetrin